MHFILLTMYKPLLVKEKGGKVVCKMVIVDVVSMHLSATWQFQPFQRPWTGIFWGAYGLSYSEGKGGGGGGLVQL